MKDGPIPTGNEFTVEEAQIPDPNGLPRQVGVDQQQAARRQQEQAQQALENFDAPTIDTTAQSVQANKNDPSYQSETTVPRIEGINKTFGNNTTALEQAFGFDMGLQQTQNSKVISRATADLLESGEQPWEINNGEIQQLHPSLQKLVQTEEDKRFVKQAARRLRRERELAKERANQRKRNKPNPQAESSNSGDSGPFSKVTGAVQEGLNWLNVPFANTFQASAKFGFESAKFLGESAASALTGSEQPSFSQEVVGDTLQTRPGKNLVESFTGLGEEEANVFVNESPSLSDSEDEPSRQTRRKRPSHHYAGC